jgi:hypothetical protein
MPAPYTDLLNEGIDDITATLTAVTGLRVVNDATKIVPNCVFPTSTKFYDNGRQRQHCAHGCTNKDRWQRAGRVAGVARNTTNQRNGVGVGNHCDVGSTGCVRDRRARISVLRFDVRYRSENGIDTWQIT